MALWAISGGAGFLGLHLARRLAADRHEVRTLDLAPLDDEQLEGRVDELHGDVRTPPTRASSSRARTCSCTRPPRSRSRPRASRSARSTSKAPPSCSPPRPRPASAASSSSPRPRSTASRQGAPDRGGRPARRRRLVRRVEDRGGAGLPRLRHARPEGRDRPAEDVRRPGAARRVRDPVRLDPRGPPDPDPRLGREPLPAARRRGPRRRDRRRRRARRGRGRGDQRRRAASSAPSAPTSRR